MAQNTTPILELRRERLSEARDTLAAAFRDNPLNRAVIGPDPQRRLCANRHGMTASLSVVVDQGGALAALRADRLVGILVATPPGGHPLPPPALWLRLRCWLGQGLRVARRWAEVFERLDALHPVEPHWYLGSLGVAPHAQGRGVGSRLLREFLARADRDALPAYLETDRRDAARLYERHGFSVVAQIEIFGAPVRCMWRGPRPA